MSMSKRDFVALADAFRVHPQDEPAWDRMDVLDTLVTFCKRQNPAFKEERWLDYLEGRCGPNGGKLKGSAS